MFKRCHLPIRGNVRETIPAVHDLYGENTKQLVKIVCQKYRAQNFKLMELYT